ncbi:hypothetical protein LCL95_00795 [Bacillus timonensis]|nr:hypothetical protein [Bacillus timonensis]
MKWLIYFLFLITYFLVSFFGYGPALFADGGNQEKMYTMIIVTLIEIVLSVFFIRWMLKKNMNKWLIAPPFLFILAVFVFFLDLWR